MPVESFADQSVTAVVRRRIKSGSEARFESLIQEFMPFMLRQPGHLGLNVIRMSPDSREYTILNRFATVADRRKFTASQEFHQWIVHRSGHHEPMQQKQRLTFARDAVENAIRCAVLCRGRHGEAAAASVARIER